MMNDQAKDWNVLWSQQQGVLHFEHMSDTIANGLAALKEDRETQFILVASGKTRAEAEEFAKTWGKTIQARLYARHAQDFAPEETARMAGLFAPNREFALN